MKLRNKKTGAIYKIEDIDLGNNADGIWIGLTKYNSLTELNEEWEDVPEESVKPYWFINDLDGEPMKCDLKNCGKSNFTKWGKHRKEIGNYFKTKEEAEKAVEKLKAWKRLKDKGFINEQVFSMNLNWCNPDDDDWKAFKLLFGGEE